MQWFQSESKWMSYQQYQNPNIKTWKTNINDQYHILYICLIFKPKLNKYGENVKGKIRMEKRKRKEEKSERGLNIRKEKSIKIVIALQVI